jgi:hypothetical protein
MSRVDVAAFGGGLAQLGFCLFAGWFLVRLWRFDHFVGFCAALVVFGYALMFGAERGSLT